MKRLNSISRILFASIAVFLLMGGFCERDEDVEPVACFTYEPVNDILPGDAVSFTNCSTDADSYKWDFDDGGESVAANPIHKFEEPGVYNVKLVATTKTFNSEMVQEVTVKSNIVACFNMSKTTAYVEEPVTFTNCSTGADSYEWDTDGDGITNFTDKDLYVYYGTAGTYNVKLTAKKGSDSKSVVHSITIIENTSSIVACFTMSPNPAAVGQTVTFTNCSTGADSYEWDINGDGTVDDYDISPAYSFNYAGTYNVKLKAKKGSAYNEVTHQLVITTATTISDPKIYDLPINWINHYFNTFDVSGDWTEGTTSDYTNAISGGVYSITNLNTTNTWYFWTNAIGMPAITKDYDFEVYYKIDYDNVTQGNGIFSSLNESTFDNYFLKMAAVEGTNYFTYGNKNNDPWDTEFYGIGGVIDTYNKLTIRKYQNNVYFFINEIYKYSVPFEGNYGEKFGFIVGALSKMTIEWISIDNMDLGSKKSATNKIFTKSDGNSYPIKGKTLIEKERSYQTSNQAKKLPGIAPTLK